MYSAPSSSNVLHKDLNLVQLVAVGVFRSLLNEVQINHQHAVVVAVVLTMQINRPFDDLLLKCLYYNGTF